LAFFDPLKTLITPLFDVRSKKRLDIRDQRTILHLDTKFGPNRSPKIFGVLSGQAGLGTSSFEISVSYFGSGLSMSDRAGIELLCRLEIVRNSL